MTQFRCTKPFTQGGQAYGCGQCLPCRFSRRRIWKTRIMLEAGLHSNNQFVTLTYADSELPFTSFDGSTTTMPTLAPRDLQLFLKRLRRKLPTKLRFYAVGEYGPKTWRPHYHAGIFNFPPCARGQTLQSYTGRRRWAECCPVCELVGGAWGHGDIEVRTLGAEKCEYLARYVTKKMTKPDDPRLVGRYPEFSRQSNRPGIGAGAVEGIANVILKYVDADQIVDVPPSLTAAGNKPLPLGRYIRKKLRLELGLSEATPDEVLQQVWSEQVLPVLQMAKASKETISLREAFRRQNAAYAESLEFKQSTFRGKI